MLLKPLYERLLVWILGTTQIFAHYTLLPVLDPGCGRPKIGQLWAYVVERDHPADERLAAHRSTAAPSSTP